VPASFVGWPFFNVGVIQAASPVRSLASRWRARRVKAEIFLPLPGNKLRPSALF
jgi:hypothetical protein